MLINNNLYCLINALSHIRADDGDEATLYANIMMGTAQLMMYKRKKAGRLLSVEEMLGWYEFTETGRPYLKEGFPDE